MGFTLVPDGEAIAAAFHSLHVFEARGFTIMDGGVIVHRDAAAGAGYSIAIASSVNAACNALVGDLYTDDEVAWTEERKCTPPYALLHFGPTREHQATQAYAKRQGNEILTYDAFPAAKAELRTLEAATLPPIEMALACAFNSRGNAVAFVPIARTVYGLTSNGITIHDMRLTGSAHGRVSTPLPTADLQMALRAAGGLAALLDQRVARFFQLGAHDNDDLKKFLYFFLAVEIEVHRTFGNLPKAQHVARGVSAESRVAVSIARLIENRDNWTNLADRFVWCVASVWTHLADDDVDEFKRLKGVRDGIAHGRIARPEHADVAAVERLAQRLYA